MADASRPPALPAQTVQVAVDLPAQVRHGPRRPGRRGARGEAGGGAQLGRVPGRVAEAAGQRVGRLGRLVEQVGLEAAGELLDDVRCQVVELTSDGGGVGAGLVPGDGVDGGGAHERTSAGSSSWDMVWENCFQEIRCSSSMAWPWRLMP